MIHSDNHMVEKSLHKNQMSTHIDQNKIFRNRTDKQTLVANQEKASLSFGDHDTKDLGATL